MKVFCFVISLLVTQAAWAIQYRCEMFVFADKYVGNGATINSAKIELRKNCVTKQQRNECNIFEKMKCIGIELGPQIYCELYPRDTFFTFIGSTEQSARIGVASECQKTEGAGWCREEKAVCLDLAK